MPEDTGGQPGATGHHLVTVRTDSKRGEQSGEGQSPSDIVPLLSIAGPEAQLLRRYSSLSQNASFFTSLTWVW